MAEFDPDAYLEKKQRSAGFDPDAYLAATTPASDSALTQFGRSAASLGDTVLDTITGTLDMAAYPLARAFMGAEQAEQETTSPKQFFGRTFGVADTPEYKGEISRRAMNAIGRGVQGLTEPIAEKTGLPQQDVNNMFGWATVGAAPPVVRGAARVPGAVVDTARNVAGATADVAGGIKQGFSGVKPGQPVSPWQTPSVRQPIGETYIPADQIARWRAGELPTAELQPRPTTELPQSALRQTQGMVPYKGQEWRALGEQIGQSYRDPTKLLAEIGGDIVLHGLPTAARLGLKGYDLYKGAQAQKQLGKAGFTPISPAELEAIQRGVNIYERRAPQPTPGPVAPTAVPGYVQPDTDAILARAKANMGENYRPPQVQTPTSAATPMTADEIIAQARKQAQPAEPTVSRSEFKSGLKDTMQAGITTRDGQVVVDKKLIDETVKAAGLRPIDWSKGPSTATAGIKDARTSVEQFVYDQVKNQFPKETRGPSTATRLRIENASKTPEELAKEAKTAQDTMSRMSKMRKMGGRSDVFEMMTGPEKTKTTFGNRQDFLEQKMINDLAGEPTIGSYPMGDKTIHVEKVAPFQNKTITYATDAQGRRVPIGDNWTAADPKPSNVATAEQIRKKLKGK